MPRKKGPSVARKVSLSLELDNKICLMLGDPKRNKLVYGSFSELVESVLWAYIRRIEQAAKDI